MAFQTDMTRVCTFQMARELSQRIYPEIGCLDPHHAMSHHRNEPLLLAANAWAATLAGARLARLGVGLILATVMVRLVATRGGKLYLKASVAMIVRGHNAFTATPRGPNSPARPSVTRLMPILASRFDT